MTGLLIDVQGLPEPAVAPQPGVGPVPTGKLLPPKPIKQDRLRSRKLWLTSEVEQVIYRCRKTNKFTSFTGEARPLTNA